MLLYSLLCLVFYVNADESFLMKHRESLIDSSKKPCDNFYERMCPISLHQSQLMLNRMSSDFSESIKPYLFSNSHQLARIFQFDVSRLPKTKDFEGQLLARCSKSERALDAFYELLPTKSGLTGCREKVEAISRAVEDEKLRKSVHMNFTLSMGKITRLSNLGAWYKYIEDKNNDFQGKHTELEKYYDILRSELIQSLNASTWVQKNNLFSRLETLLGSIKLHPWTPSHLPEKVMEKIIKNYEECRDETISGFHVVEYELCVGYAVSFVEQYNGLHKTDLDAWRNGISIPNSAFENNIITVKPATYRYLEIGDETVKMATLGFMLVHELSHAVYMNERNIEMSFMKDQMSCIRSHMNNVCGKFKSANGHTKECRSGHATRTEDLADWSALGVTINALTRMAAQKKLKLPKDVNAAQLFFEALAINACSHMEVNDGIINTHSTDKMRINGMFMQSPDFRHVFGCKAGDNMVEAKTCYEKENEGTIQKKWEHLLKSGQ